MKILSLFDGISCARVAFDRAGIPVEAYIASEIDKYAIQVSEKNYPEIKRAGSVEIVFPPIGWFDILIGGSPCQDLSIAKANRQGLKGKRSGLFYEYVRILKEAKPKFFVLENVASMPKEAKATITEELWGIEPVMINAALVSAQNRKRLFWVGKLAGDRYEQVDIPLPEDRGIMLRDILESGEEEVKPVALRNRGQGKKPEYNKTGRANSLTTVQTDSMVEENEVIRKLTPIECERLQGLPDNYTEGVSNTQRYKALGNAFNVDVIAHILKHLK